ncbi:hypothetical protein CALCODRAFT_50240 [Calocera cornea HHB12733]|uniref:Uncharacterized protein n=1 Tax=Calocera cornea HHB12733 TaxID=1353952 RepID=A0A165DSV1_9BASI|nr:hypothetical protein CALCODRAFT_50240 [Calocera cornea HHB12733]
MEFPSWVLGLALVTMCPSQTVGFDNDAPDRPYAAQGHIYRLRLSVQGASPARQCTTKDARLQLIKLDYRPV